MSRRSTPERIAAAKEAGTLSWLRTTMQQTDAGVEELMAAWATEADARGLTRTDSAYWNEARPWLKERSH